LEFRVQGLEVGFGGPGFRVEVLEPASARRSPRSDPTSRVRRTVPPSAFRVCASGFRVWIGGVSGLGSRTAPP
jgi:hypothetical protein